MLEALPGIPRSFRIMRRQAVRPPVNLTVRPVRPSLMEFRLTGDAWIVVQEADCLSLRFNDWQLAVLAGAVIDVPSLNRWLERLRSRPVRRRR